MKTLTEIQWEIAREKEKYFRNYLFWCKKIKRKAKKILGEDVTVLVFGSVVKGQWTPRSDIDVLIISKYVKNNWEENTLRKVEIKKAVSLFSPFQIHLATPSEYRNWWKKFIKRDYRVVP